VTEADPGGRGRVDSLPRMIRAARRALGGASVGFPIVLIAGMASCTGGDADVGPSTVPRIGATNYVTQPVVTLPPPTVPGQTTPAGGTTQAAQEYRIRNGDTVSGIARRYGITTDQLVDFNGWDSASHVIIRGDIIKIPPFADIPGQSDSTSVETLFIEGPTCADGTEQETYEIESGDFLGRVANKLDVSVEALNAANETTGGYEIFYPGLEIMVPCPEDDVAGTDVETTEG
jgi:LysM repeat protein